MFLLFSVQFAPFANYLTNQVHSHTETALDAPKNEGLESSFPIKMHSRPGKPPAICKISVVQP